MLRHRRLSHARFAGLNRRGDARVALDVGGRSASVARLSQPMRQVWRVTTLNEPTMRAKSGLREATAIAVWKAMSCSIASSGRENAWRIAKAWALIASASGSDRRSVASATVRISMVRRTS